MFALLERTLRISAYFLILLVGSTQLYTWYVATQQSDTERAKMVSSLIGRRVDIREANGKAALVFALSTSCQFCTASAPFYQRLTTEVAARPLLGVRTIAMFPEPAESSKEYVNSTLRTTFDSVVQGVPEGVQATPTVLFVHKDGKIRNAWVGRLARDQEEKLLAALLQSSF